MTNAAGDARRVGEREETTFEHVARFSGSSFDDERRLDEVFRAVCAASAFPVAFEPVEVSIRGRGVPCFDGGLVDDAPIKHAVEDPFISRVFVVAPFPAKYEPPSTGLHGAGLVVPLAEILVQARLYRALREARETNEALARLRAVVPYPRVRAALLEAIGWRNKRQIELVEIRPREALPGGAFDGFCKPALRDTYIEAGDDAVRAWLSASALGQRVGH